MATTRDPRAETSGFAKKLDAFLRNGTLIRNNARLSEWLTEQGEPVTPGPVGDWRMGKSLPNARYIGLLERIMGAPWSYLDDPETPWPRSDGAEAFQDLVRLLTSEQIDRWSSRLRDEIRRRALQ